MLIEKKSQMADWLFVKICKGTIGSTYGKSYKAEDGQTFADLIEQMPELNISSVTKVSSP